MRRKLVICLIIFVGSFAVRFIVWQNNKLEMATVQSVVTVNYLRDAHALASDDIRVFLGGDNPPTDARVIDHPPGYPLMIGIVSAISDNIDVWRIAQLALNSLAPVLLFLIAAPLFDQTIGLITAALAALSPQLAYHSGMLLPDELSVIPVLAAVYFLMRAPRILNAVPCGVCLGLSCWLRSNALVLPVFFALAALLVVKETRLQFAAMIFFAFVMTIAPITIRNAIYFDGFIPLSLGGGTTLVEGLGDIDDGSRGLPRTDEDVMAVDESIDLSLGDYNGKPYSSLYDPNGVERESRRIGFARTVIANEPLWFAAGVAKRGLSTFRLERVPAIAAERDERDTTTPVLYWIDRSLKFIQRAFVSAVFLPLVLLGLIVIAVRGGWRELVVILVVPLYYATVQPLVHTEYRYVLATPHVLMIAAAVAMCWLFGRVTALIRRDRAGLSGA